MARSGPAKHAKRQREVAKQEKRKAKAERRALRKQQKAEKPDIPHEPGVDPDLDGIVPGDRATGVAVRPEGDGYTVVLTADNDPQRTGRPCRMVQIRDVRL